LAVELLAADGRFDDRSLRLEDKHGDALPVVRRGARRRERSARTVPRATRA
jgi:hypothetical protein